MQDDALRAQLDVVTYTRYRNSQGSWIEFGGPVLLEDIKSEPGIAVVAVDDGAKYQDLGAISSVDLKRGVESHWSRASWKTIAGENKLVAFVLPIDSDEYLTRSADLLADIKSKFPWLAIQRQSAE